jgi:hypothetical protein
MVNLHIAPFAPLSREIAPEYPALRYHGDKNNAQQTHLISAVYGSSSEKRVKDVDQNVCGKGALRMRRNRGYEFCELV